MVACGVSEVPFRECNEGGVSDMDTQNEPSKKAEGGIAPTLISSVRKRQKAQSLFMTGAALVERAM
jgi:hypothetical protein